MSTAAASEPAQNVCEPPTEDAESQSHRRKRSRSSYFSDSGFAENRTSLDLKTLMTDSTWQKQSGTPILNPDWPDMAWTATSGSPAHDAVIVKDREQEGPPYEVHGGMLRLARAMGSKGKPVYEAVLAALSKNRRYGEKALTREVTFFYSTLFFRVSFVRALTGCRPGDFVCFGMPCCIGRVSFLKLTLCVSDVGRPCNLPDSAIEWTPSKPPSICLCFCPSVSICCPRNPIFT